MSTLVTVNLVTTATCTLCESVYHSDEDKTLLSAALYSFDAVQALSSLLAATVALCCFGKEVASQYNTVELVLPQSLAPSCRHRTCSV